MTFPGAASAASAKLLESSTGHELSTLSYDFTTVKSETSRNACFSGRAPGSMPPRGTEPRIPNGLID